MTTYECCLLDSRNEVVTVEVIDCAYDVDARHSADDLLIHRPEFHGVEVWRRRAPSLRECGRGRRRSIAGRPTHRRPV